MMVTKALTASSKLFALLAIACCMLGLLSSNVAKGDIVIINIAAANCTVTDTKTGSKPCYDKAGGQCKYNDNPSTCTASTDGTKCECAAVTISTDTE